MTFKEMIAADNKSIFLNPKEFADIHNIVYDGKTYYRIPVLLTKVKQSERPVPVGDNVKGLFLVSAIAHIDLKDMDGVIPEKGQKIEIDDGMALGHPFFQKYKVVTSDCEMGMIVLELEAYGE